MLRFAKRICELLGQLLASPRRGDPYELLELVGLPVVTYGRLVELPSADRHLMNAQLVGKNVLR